MRGLPCRHGDWRCRTRSASRRASTRTRACRMRVLGMGFGLAEIGTVTPLPQEGNPRPRVFRLIARPGGDQPAGLQQRRTCGGARAAARAPADGRGRRQHRRQQGCGGPRRRTTWPACEAFYDVASYFTINISSPNTPGLRDLQAPAALDDLLARVLAARAELVICGQAATADRREARARHRRGGPGADRARAAAPRRRRHRRVEHDAGARWAQRDVRSREKRAACRGGRCSTAPR